MIEELKDLIKCVQAMKTENRIHAQYRKTKYISFVTTPGMRSTMLHDSEVSAKIEVDEATRCGCVASYRRARPEDIANYGPFYTTTSTYSIQNKDWTCVWSIAPTN